jgi:triosephosphate isomerase (TIM)
LTSVPRRDIIEKFGSGFKVRKKLVVGNWKMNGNLAQNQALLVALGAVVQPVGVDVVICPPCTYLSQVRALLEGGGIALGGQNLSAFKEGPHTGEVSGAMLIDSGCEWVIVGHSERRNANGETNDVVAAKVQAALESGLRPILCVGETLQQREGAVAEDVVGSQLDAVVSVVGPVLASSVVVAYEPIWAIGTGKTATPEQAQAMHAFIRARLAQCGVAIQDVKILYGGSVTAVSAPQLFGKPDIDGALVGGASLVAEGFSAICAAAAAS